MFRKLTLLTAAAMMFAGTEGYAMPDDEAYNKCMAKAVADAEVTKCMEQAIKATEKAISEQKQDLSKAIEDNKDLPLLDNYYMKYSKSYCLYYVAANAGNGYSNEYNKAKCLLASYLQYYTDLLSLYNSAITDFVG